MEGKFPAGVMCLLFFGDERYADVGDSGDAQVAKTRRNDDAVERVESAFLFDNERFLVGRAESLAYPSAVDVGERTIDSVAFNHRVVFLEIYKQPEVAIGVECIVSHGEHEVAT